MSTTTPYLMSLDTALGFLFLSVVFLTFLIFVLYIVYPTKEITKDYNDF
jgi:F0F1-type ATP synthase membrane subunit b/b'